MAAKQQQQAAGGGWQEAKAPRARAAGRPAGAATGGDTAELDATLDAWVDAKSRRDYAVADRLKCTLHARGIYPDTPPKSAPQLADRAPDAAAEAMLDDWASAKRRRDFGTAMRLQARLRARGVDPVRARPRRVRPDRAAAARLLADGAACGRSPLPQAQPDPPAPAAEQVCGAAGCANKPRRGEALCGRCLRDRADAAAAVSGAPALGAARVVAKASSAAQSAGSEPPAREKPCKKEKTGARALPAAGAPRGRTLSPQPPLRAGGRTLSPPPPPLSPAALPPPAGEARAAGQDEAGVAHPSPAAAPAASPGHASTAPSLAPRGAPLPQPAPRPAPAAGAGEVRAFLARHNLAQFADALVAEGYDDVATLCEVSDDELLGADVGMGTGHMRRLRRVLPAAPPPAVPTSRITSSTA